VIAAPAQRRDGRTVGVQFIFPDLPNFGWASILQRLS